MKNPVQRWKKIVKIRITPTKSTPLHEKKVLNIKEEKSIENPGVNIENNHGHMANSENMTKRITIENNSLMENCWETTSMKTVLDVKKVDKLEKIYDEIPD